MCQTWWLFLSYCVCVCLQSPECEMHCQADWPTPPPRERWVGAGFLSGRVLLGHVMCSRHVREWRKDKRCDIFLFFFSRGEINSRKRSARLGETKFRGVCNEIYSKRIRWGNDNCCISRIRKFFKKSHSCNSNNFKSPVCKSQELRCDVCFY